jgi:hypothetical protein
MNDNPLAWAAITVVTGMLALEYEKHIEVFFIVGLAVVLAKLVEINARLKVSEKGAGNETDDYLSDDETDDILECSRSMAASSKYLLVRTEEPQRFL